MFKPFLKLLLLLFGIYVMYFLALMLFGLSRESARQAQTFNLTQGDVIVSAIYAYEEKYQTVPTSLDQLSPEFLAEIPLTQAQTPFVYNPTGRLKNEPWSISFEIEGYGGCAYRPHYQFWDCWPPGAGGDV